MEVFSISCAQNSISTTIIKEGQEHSHSHEEDWVKTGNREGKNKGHDLLPKENHIAAARKSAFEIQTERT